MQAANDNLDGCVSGFDDWVPLHEAVRKVVEACARERAASHQVGGREDTHGETDLQDCGRDHRETRPFLASDRNRKPLREACAWMP